MSIKENHKYDVTNYDTNPQIGTEGSESALNDLLSTIDELDDKIRIESMELLKMRHQFLKAKGWEIVNCTGDFIPTWVYIKNNETFVCEHEAIDQEIHGT